MCGIVGYIGPKAATPFLLEGLKRLEYRGYDSAGLALLHEGRLDRRRQLLRVDVDVVTFGQYLRPTMLHLPVREHLTPARFKALEDRAMQKGFLYVASGPLVRSSYKAAEFYLAGLLRQRKALDAARAANGNQTANSLNPKAEQA